MKNTHSGRRILVAEDNEINLSMLLDVLKIHGYDVVGAKNGAEAVELAMKHKPDLILMDIRMPVMGGLTATRKLRSMPEFANIPIVALTANTSTDDEAAQTAFGCTEHLAKPFRIDELFELLNKYLKDKENQ